MKITNNIENNSINHSHIQNAIHSLSTRIMNTWQRLCNLFTNEFIIRENPLYKKNEFVTRENPLYQGKSQFAMYENPLHKGEFIHLRKSIV